MQRRCVRIDSITPIGKESNSLEEVQAGLVHDEQDVYTVYTDPRRDYWSREVAPALRQVPLNVWERESGGKSRRILIDARHGRASASKKSGIADSSRSQTRCAQLRCNGNDDAISILRWPPDLLNDNDLDRPTL